MDPEIYVYTCTQYILNFNCKDSIRSYTVQLAQLHSTVEKIQNVETNYMVINIVYNHSLNYSALIKGAQFINPHKSASGC